jgi:hypothetical protein
MLFMRALVVAVVLVGPVLPGQCKATRCVQLTTDGRSVGGTFSAVGDDIAYVRFAQKHFDKQWGPGFDLAVTVRDDGTPRDLLSLPATLPTRESTLLPWRGTVRVRWLPSGDYLLVGNRAPGAWLVAVDGSARTKVGKHENWFVTNEEVPLTRDDQAAISHLLRVAAMNEWYFPPWLADREGHHTGPTFRRPGHLPAESRDWYFEVWCITPDARHAVFEMRDKHFEGCSCTKGYQTCHLGQMDCRNGAFTQLTFSSQHRQVRPIWSPDGKWIAYVRQQKGGGPGQPPTRRDLWVMRRDGWDDRLIARDVGYWHQWLNSEWIVYETSQWPHGHVQIGTARAATAEGQRLTSGPFRHELCDFRSGKFLVEEHPPSKTGDPWWQFTSNLYIIEPLRVRM